jgi:hypothetical protein
VELAHLTNQQHDKSLSDLSGLFWLSKYGKPENVAFPEMGNLAEQRSQVEAVLCPETQRQCQLSPNWTVMV